MSNKEREVLSILFNRYLSIIEKHNGEALPIFCSLENKNTPEHLKKMIQEALLNGSIYPTDKLQRWLGYVQGVLTCYGWISVDEERDFTRPLLHSIHDKAIPSFG